MNICFVGPNNTKKERATQAIFENDKYWCGVCAGKLILLNYLLFVLI
jgi:hypothetical protein